MTLDELLAREAIRATMAKAAQSGDSLRAEDYAACFTEDGTLQSERAPGDFVFRYESRAAILEWQNRWKTGAPSKDVVRVAKFVRHNLSTSKIELTGPDTAKVRTYWTAWTDAGPDHCGVYMDEFRRVGDDWLISLRRVKTEWAAPDSRFASADAVARS